MTSLTKLNDVKTTLHQTLSPLVWFTKPTTKPIATHDKTHNKTHSHPQQNPPHSLSPLRWSPNHFHPKIQPTHQPMTRLDRTHKHKHLHKSHTQTLSQITHTITHTKSETHSVSTTQITQPLHSTKP
jgi:hypothetical protein